MSVVDDLKAAREIVAQRWHKGGLHDGRGNVCAWGALSITCFDDMVLVPLALWGNPLHDRRTAAVRELRKHIPEEFNSLSAYNDADGVTCEDMLALFDKALAELGGLA